MKPYHKGVSMSLASALRSDSNAPVAWHVQRMVRGDWETICVVTSGCNQGRWGALDKMKRMHMESELRKYKTADAKGCARIVTWEA